MSSSQERAYRCDDLANSHRTLNDGKSERSDLGTRQASECSHDKNLVGRQHDAYFFVRLARPGQFVQVDHEHARFHVWRTIESRKGPRVNGDNVVNIADLLEVVAAWGACA